MPYEIRQKNGKHYVIDTGNNDKIRGGPYDDENDAEDRLDSLSFREETRERLRRMPVTEMTAEEKALAYDKMMAEKNQSPPDPNLPPKKDPPTDDKPKKRSAYWGDMLEDR